MTNEIKLLRAFIEAQGYEVEEVYIPLNDFDISNWNNCGQVGDRPAPTTDYKVTKTPYNKRPMLHRIVRSYEKGEISHDEMVARIIERGE